MTSPLQQEIARIICCGRGGCMNEPDGHSCASDADAPIADLIISRVLDACGPVTEEMDRAWNAAISEGLPEIASRDWSVMLAAKRRELLGEQK